jgi:DNA-directed RNA polymerase subunit D
MAISIKKLDEKGNVSRYLVKGISPAFINAIRRSAMLHTPCLAIEDVSIYENDSVMFDEMLAHRLALLPVKMDKTYKDGDKVKLVLEKEGECTVYSKDIKSTDPKIEIVDKNIPVTRLGKDQRLKVEMQAIVMPGSEHAKWQPAIVAYSEVPEILVSKECNECGACIKACPKGILKMSGKKISLEDALECSLCGACVDSCAREAIKIGFEKESYVMVVEPVAGLAAKECIEGAVKALLDKTKDFSKSLQKIK